MATFFTTEAEMQHRLDMVKDDLECIKKFIADHGLTEIFNKATSMADNCFVHISNIEIACDINDSECLDWSPFS
jgi:hypothetical protein